MKSFRTGIALFVILLIGIAVISRSLTRQEEKQRLQHIVNKGSHLVSLISLYPIRDFQADRRDFFLRTLTQYTSYEGLVYFFIHDHLGHCFVSLGPSGMASEIPKDIQTKALLSTGLTKQTFKAIGSENTIYEFAKPIFEDGQRTGTVRLGLAVSPISLFSLENISLLAMIAFFIFAAMSFGYYGVLNALKPLRNLNQRFRSTDMGSGSAVTSPVKNGRITSIIEGLEQSLTEIKKKLNQTQADNVRLTSNLGVLTFERNQVINILNSINFGIIITDIQDNIGHINDYVLNLLNKTRDHVIDRSLGEVLQHDEITSFILRQGTLEQTRAINHIDTTFPELAPGEIFRVSFSYLMDVEKAPIGKMILFHNITKEKAAEKATHDFTVHLSHELLTPLTTIKSYSEMLMDGEILDSETQKEFYNTINLETDRLTHLIRALLDVSKIEMGNLTLNKGLVKSDWLFEDSVAAVEGAALKKNISIQRNLPDHFPALVGDKDQLKASLINILGNAVKYTPENGNIQFSVREQKDNVIFDVIDTGHGISPEDLPNIFDKFYRSKNPQISEQQGTGLGLAFTSEIVRLHDGDIEVESELGKGTRFTVKIPKEEYRLESQ